MQPFSQARGKCYITRFIEWITRARRVLRVVVAMFRSVTFWEFLLQSKPTA